mgnify:CR=1 FL=1
MKNMGMRWRFFGQAGKGSGGCRRCLKSEQNRSGRDHVQAYEGKPPA